MKYLNMSLAIFLAALTISCVSAPSREELQSADYGPFPELYEETIKSFMSNRLKDPMSAQFNFRGLPKTMWAGGGLGGPRKYGWGVCALINARNSFGGYVGFQNHFFLINNGSVVLHDGSPYTADKACSAFP